MGIGSGGNGAGGMTPNAGEHGLFCITLPANYTPKIALIKVLQGSAICLANNIAILHHGKSEEVNLSSPTPVIRMQVPRHYLLRLFQSLQH